jgi:peptidoglycan/xylan/chitin deacetylase (PgdA/CDA1 family)
MMTADAMSVAATGLPPISILMYHQVGEFSSPESHRASFCHVKRFSAQMWFLKRFGYNVVSLDQAAAALFEGQPLSGRPVVLTFDDGYRNFLDYAFPVLCRHRFPATVFLVTGRIGQDSDWVRRAGRQAAPLMSVAEIRDLSTRGIGFGAHSVTHPRLSQIEPARMRDEVQSSKAQLEAILQSPVAHFCYPYGDYDAAVRDAVANAGFDTGLTCIRGAANGAHNAFEIPRKAISYGDSLAGYWWKLHMKHRRKDPAGYLK